MSKSNEAMECTQWSLHSEFPLPPKSPSQKVQLPTEIRTVKPQQELGKSVPQFEEGFALPNPVKRTSKIPTKKPRSVGLSLAASLNRISRA